MGTGKAKLLVATTNRGKLRELSALLAASFYAPISLSDVCIDADVAETGSTLEENAALKAATYSRLSGMITLADDSGLEVDALGGEPGVRSSRYAGAGATDAQKIAFLLQRLNTIDEEEWTARFRCVIAVASPGESPALYAGECYGRIIRESRGENGFGYDPVFLLPELGKTMAELSAQEKNHVSHRARAAQKAVEGLKVRAGGLDGRAV